MVFRAMRTQLLQWQRSGLDGVLESIYFGGGTPSLVAGEVVDLLGFIKEEFLVHAGAEVTAEANPDSLDRSTVAMLAEAGVTRVSLGVQSFSDRELRVLGRVHDAETAERACSAVSEAGLALSIDLMCAIPGQSRASWSTTLQRAADTGAEHVSVYPLTVEDGTPMQVAVDARLVEAVDSDVAAEHLVLAEAALGYHGFQSLRGRELRASPRGSGATQPRLLDRAPVHRAWAPERTGWSMVRQHASRVCSAISEKTSDGCGMRAPPTSRIGSWARGTRSS